MRFIQIAHPEKGNFLAIPEVSSQNRKYIPVGYLDESVICSNKLYMLPNASLYIFGVFNSIVHNSWMRTFTGRMKSDYSYSPQIVYNNLVWPTINESEKLTIEKTAQQILDARSKYQNATLSDMYGENMYLYPELLKAHEANDKAVMDAYGFDYSLTESEIVAKLMKMYQNKIKESSTD